MAGRLVDALDVIKAVNRHTDDDGKLDDDISIILEEVEMANTMTEEDAIAILQYIDEIVGGADNHKAISMAIKALKQTEKIREDAIVEFMANVGEKVFGNKTKV